MKKVLVVAAFFLPILLYGFDLVTEIGYSYATPTGWNLGLGAWQDGFEADVNVTFFFGKETEYEFNVFTFLPLIPIGPLSLGVTANFFRGNFADRDRGALGMGIRLYAGAFSVIATFTTPIYPSSAEFDASMDFYFRLRYFLRPPPGRYFKDRLYFSLTYSGQSYRVTAGLMEPLP